MRIVDNSKIV